MNTIESLNKILANTYSLYLKTQNFHWNVTGPHFKALHELFGIQYEAMIPAIDIVAERIRTLGEKVDGSYEHFAKLTVFEAGNKDLGDEDMVKELVSSNNKLIELLKEGAKIAEDNNDSATADILIGQTESYQKHVWMLNSSL